MSSAHKRFNTLTRQIEQARQSLHDWQTHSAAYREHYAAVMAPLEREQTALQRRWVEALELALRNGRWTKGERKLLAELLCETAGELLEEGHGDDALKALYEKHAGVDFDTEQREAALAIKAMAENLTGFDLGDDDGIRDNADLAARMQAFLAAEDAERASRAAAQAEAQAGTGARRASAAQKRREAEAQQATQSLREVYRKLASALHPDREVDPAQRDAKTELMQRVNQAYEKRDLLGLLQLQLQIEQIDPSHIANASAQRIKHFNKVLSEQLSELKAELEHVKMQFLIEFNLEDEWRLDPRQLGKLLQDTQVEMRAINADQQRLLTQLSTDPEATKRWLKTLREASRRRRDADPFGWP